MPPTNCLKQYKTDSYYHVYNRGVNKMKIFLDEGDYWNFRRTIRRKLRDFSDDFQVKINAFALMPNHFHLLFYQKTNVCMVQFMRSTMTRYAKYYCKKYNYSGHVFESRYKAIYLPSKQDWERIRLYILNNPLEAGYSPWKHVGIDI